MTNNDRAPKNARREAARETARLQREQEQKRQRRNRFFLQGGIGAAVVVVALVVILVVVNSNSGSTAKVSTEAGPANLPTDGILFTGVNGSVTPTLGSGVAAGATPKPVASSNADGSAKVVTYIDWACPACKQFEATYSSEIQSLVANGTATLEIHPVSILDRSYQNSRYASRAANAAACVANFDPDKFLAVQNEFYDNQPTEGSTGLTDTQIKRLIARGGVVDKKVTTCVDSETYKSWVTAATNRATSDPALVNPTSGGFSTPTVVVNGKRWDNTTDLLSLIKKS
ncbi:thioredoxin domain-containing protein [Frondihabitans cladoniiphilus]|uniref:Thioredoxin domain-containing protein n=1 Tax=Frondihabitans cladoniiphilus TaxID=715785 RepID=A0ABP8W4X6_9MICO